MSLVLPIVIFVCFAENFAFVDCGLQNSSHLSRREAWQSSAVHQSHWLSLPHLSRRWPLRSHSGSADEPAEDLYGIFKKRVRRERPPEFSDKVRGLTKWVPRPVKMTESSVQESINLSRNRMDVACLDILWFHWWDYSNPAYLDALKHLTDLKEEGKIKTLALTNFDTERLQIILENELPVVSNQVQHSIVYMRPQQWMAELCQNTGVKLITYGTVWVVSYLRGS